MFINCEIVKRILAIFSLPLLLNGCGSFYAYYGGTDEYYGGVKLDVRSAIDKPLLIPLALVDLPFSFIADTLIIPRVLYCHNYHVCNGVDYKAALTNQSPVEVEIDKYTEALENNESRGDKQGMVLNYRDMGAEYYKHGYSEKAVEMYGKALEIDQALGIKKEIATDYRLQGEVYYSDNELDKAIEKYNKVLETYQALDLKQDIADNYNVLGVLYFQQNNLDKAIELFNKALKLNQELDIKENIALTFRNLGDAYKQKGNKTEAEFYYQKTIELYKQSDNATANEVQVELDALMSDKHLDEMKQRK